MIVFIIILICLITVFITLFNLNRSNNKNIDIPHINYQEENLLKDKIGKYVPSGIIKTRKVEKEYFRKIF